MPRKRPAPARSVVAWKVAVATREYDRANTAREASEAAAAYDALVRARPLRPPPLPVPVESGAARRALVRDAADGLLGDSLVHSVNGGLRRVPTGPFGPKSLGKSVAVRRRRRP